MFVETIRNKKLPPFDQIWTTRGFKMRAQEGFQRVKQTGAESGFIVVDDGEKLLVSDLFLGGKIPDDDSEEMLGMAPEVLELITEEDSDLLIDRYGLNNSLELVGSFHFHPWVGAISHRFSQPDMEVYDSLHIDNRDPFSVNPQYVYGILAERYNHLLASQGSLFAFQGPATSNEYQGEDFSLITADKQEQILRRSGFKVVRTDLAGRNGKILPASFRSIVLA